MKENNCETCLYEPDWKKLITKHDVKSLHGNCKCPSNLITSKEDPTVKLPECIELTENREFLPANCFWYKSKENNCFNCHYEPDWKLYKSNRVYIGRCKWPVNLLIPKALPATIQLNIITIERFGDITNVTYPCPTWRAKFLNKVL